MFIHLSFQDPSEVLSTLQNPNSHLKDIISEYKEHYLTTLFDAQMEKKEIAINKVSLQKIYFRISLIKSIFRVVMKITYQTLMMNS